MSLAPPITTLSILTGKADFYAGFNQFVAIGSKVLIGLLILWAAVFPDQAEVILPALNNWWRTYFGHWNMYVAFFYIVVRFGLAI